ncbi:Transport and Golgi organization protein 2 [Arabidopsis suecica]|uniref:Transport and Golgi organization protein 2 n=1 Tax=Arabidopsis suecica TaxID=45249 RepID=A0A8T2CBR7_ARASU|nr:Transport and Golgi organization protein 2 [Arabidopsis suecica]
MDRDTVVFQWSGDSLVLLVNTDGNERGTRDPLVWSDADGLSCKRFGYKEGRVVFLFNSHEHSIDPDLLPSFLKCKKTPRRFVEDFPQKEVENFGPNLKLLVADVNTESLVYVSKQSGDEKKLRVDDVDHGVHTISVSGFDIINIKDTILRGNFNRMIAGHAELPPIQKIVEDLMRKPPFFIGSVDSDGARRTVRIFGMDIEANRLPARFYESHLNDKGEWES